MNLEVSAVTLAPGRGGGAPLLLEEPLSFWGGLDPTTGRIIDRWHPQAGARVAGRVLMMPAGRGSSSGSATLAEAIRLGVGPAAILLLKRDAIVIVGALVAAELYARPALSRWRGEGSAATRGGAMAQHFRGAAGREDCHSAAALRTARR